MRRGILIASVWLIAVSGLFDQAAWAQLVPGDIVVIDITAGGKGALFVTNPITGARRLLSDFANAGQGPLGIRPFSIAVGPGNSLLVIDQSAGTDCGFGKGCGALFSVDSVTGFRTMVSDFGNPSQGPTGLRPYGLATEAGILVTDDSAPFIPNANIAGTLFLVGGGGTRTIVSDFTDANQGPQGARPSGVAVASGGAIVADPFGKLFRVDLGNGSRTILSDFKNPAQGPALGVPDPVALTPDINNQLLVVDQLGRNLDGAGTLYSVNANTGFRTVISDFSTTAQGPLAFNLFDVKLTADNEILVVDLDGGTDSLGSVLKVDRATGQRDCVSDLGSAAQGPLGKDPSGLVVIPGVRPPGLSSVAAILPASRSVRVNQVATAFVTIINTGADAARNVGITTGCRVPIRLSYQTTDPNTNALTGTVNTPVDIPSKGRQTFVIAMTPTAAFAPTDLGLNFGGENTARVEKLSGLNTLLLSASNTPVPDIVALGATIGNTGIVNIPGDTGTGAFGVATVNVGVAGPITVSAETSGANLPVNIALCETDPATALCISPIGSTVTTQIAAGATPTFTALITGTGFVPFDPALNRIIVLFKDGLGVIRGATSVAVRTL